MTEEENKKIMEGYHPETNLVQPQPIAPVETVVPQVQPVAPIVQAPVIPPVAPVVQAPVIPPVAPSPILESVSQPEDSKKKGFWNKVWKGNKLKRPESVAILFLHENGSAEPMIIQSKKGFFNIKGKTYHERNDCTFTMMGKDRYPLAIIDELSITPRGTKDWEMREIQEKISLLQDHAIKGIRHAERVRLGERSEMQLNGKAIVGIGILVMIGIAFLVSYI